MTPLKQYGWNQFQLYDPNKNQSNDHLVGRVITVKGFKYYLITEKGELETELSGRLLYGNDPENLPRVGDWVSYLDYGDNGYIIDVLPRTNALTRKAPGNKIEKQVLAANIDYAFIVQGLDRDFNLMRLERYLTQITGCQITPVVILNKSDLVENTEPYRQEILKLKRDVALLFCSTVTGQGIDEIKKHLLPEKTYIMIGSSGVGKSSLMNVLMEQEIRKTSSTSNASSKGRHTTTTRDLLLLPSGGLLIDTPGMREFGVTDSGDQSAELMFPAIDAYSGECRYSDCKHLNESGCAVLAAVEHGDLDSKVYESYVKLLKEQRRFEINVEDKKRMNKQFGRMTKEAKDHRKKYKY